MTSSKVDHMLRMVGYADGALGLPQASVRPTYVAGFKAGRKNYSEFLSKKIERNG